MATGEFHKSGYANHRSQLICLTTANIDLATSLLYGAPEEQNLHETSF